MVYCKLIYKGGKKSQKKTVPILQKYFAGGANSPDAISAFQELGTI